MPKEVNPYHAPWDHDKKIEPQIPVQQHKSAKPSRWTSFGFRTFNWVFGTNNLINASKAAFPNKQPGIKKNLFNPSLLNRLGRTTTELSYFALKQLGLCAGYQRAASYLEHLKLFELEEKFLHTLKALNTCPVPLNASVPLNTSSVSLNTCPLPLTCPLPSANQTIPLDSYVDTATCPINSIPWNSFVWKQVENLTFSLNNATTSVKDFFADYTKNFTIPPEYQPYTKLSWSCYEWVKDNPGIAIGGGVIAAGLLGSGLYDISQFYKSKTFKFFNKKHYDDVPFHKLFVGMSKITAAGLVVFFIVNNHDELSKIDYKKAFSNF